MRKHNTQVLEEQARTGLEWSEQLKKAAQFRVDYLRWLAAHLRGPEGADIVIRKDAANAILQLIGDIE